MKKYYFTFGYGQLHENKYVVIEADSYEEAREEMYTRFGTKWSFQYTEKEWIDKDGISMAENWNLTELK